MEYQAIYKCRMCGELFGTGITSEEYASLLTINLGIENPATRVKNHTMNRHIKHDCADGNIGFADFQGFRKVEE